MDLARLNAAPEDLARAEFLSCCASEAWAEAMCRRRPFSGVTDLLQAAADEWWVLDEEDWLQAFAAHPRIGDRVDNAGRHADWSRREQSGVDDAADTVRAALATRNAEYESRFGHVYLVFASEKTADEMLALCEERLHNDPDEEFLIAAGEQAKITDLRLRRLLGID